MSNYQHERGWLDSEVWGNAPYDERAAWSWMIGEANWKDEIKNISGHPVLIARGQFTASIRFMAQRFKWSTARVQRYMVKLRAWGMIKTDTQTDTAQNIITICNYNTYQGKRGKTDTATSTGSSTGSSTGPIHPRAQTRSQSSQSSHIYIPDDVSEIVWNDFVTLRKAKKAPITQTVIKKIQNEAKLINWTLEQALAEMALRGWQGFKAEWITNKKTDQKSKSMQNLQEIAKNGW